MQPKTRRKLDKEAFEVLKKTIRNIPVSQENIKIPKVPEFIAIKLTNQCNMRCKHCYEWNERGYHNLLDKESQKDILSIKTFQALLEETRDAKSRLYLWGGEPLLHPNFSQIAELLVKDPREVSICTNGTLIEKNIDSLIKIGASCKLEMLVAIEGFEEQHDTIRGKGTYQKMYRQLEQMLMLRRQGKFKGKISVHTVINDNNVNDLYKLLCFYEELGIDLVLLCYPWYISEHTSAEMTEYFKDEFHWLLNENKYDAFSWDSFKFKLSQDKVADLQKQLKNINKKAWNNCVRYQPDLEGEELINFINGGKSTDKSIKQCLSIFTRTDIFPNGDVSVCKHFNEFTIGNLNDMSLREIWNSESYQKIRKKLEKGLMPVCSKCNALYLHNLRK